VDPRPSRAGIGASGDADRDREEEARRYFDEHGEWPEDSTAPKGGRKWRLASGVATPESEAAQRTPPATR
jgi:hypothetical protein